MTTFRDSKLDSNSKRYPHQCGLSEELWVWAQNMSGMKNPTQWVRDFLNETRIRSEMMLPTSPVVEAEPEPEPIAPEPEAVASPEFTQEEKDYIEALWEEIGCGKNFDVGFSRARAAWVTAHGGHEPALKWTIEGFNEGRIKYPRGYIIAWFKDSQE